jgi:hypothetical protein
LAGGRRSSDHNRFAASIATGARRSREPCEAAGRVAISERRAPRPRGHPFDETIMCRNIRTLANFAPPATEDEVRASALQFVRKLSGTTRPSRANQAAFDLAVEEVAAAARRLLDSLVTTAPPRDREEEARRARERSRARFG